MPLKFDLRRLGLRTFELKTFKLGLNREQLIALAVAAAIIVLCVTALTLSLGVRSEALAELGDKQDALALLEARVGGGAKGRGPVRNPAAPASAWRRGGKECRFRQPQAEACGYGKCRKFGLL